MNEKDELSFTGLDFFREGDGRETDRSDKNTEQRRRNKNIIKFQLNKNPARHNPSKP